MKKPTNRSEMRGERKGLIKGFIIAIVVFASIAYFSHSHGQSYEGFAYPISEDITMFRDSDLEPVTQMYISVVDSQIHITYEEVTKVYELYAKERISDNIVILKANGMDIKYFHGKEMIEITRHYCDSPSESGYFKLF